MSPATRAGLRQALAVGLAAAAASTLRISQPFLVVLAAQILAGMPCHGIGEFARRVAFAAAGAGSGALLLTAFPQQPWFSFPLFAMAVGWGTSEILSRFGGAAAITFGIGLVATFPAGVIDPVAGIDAGFIHFGALMIAAVSAWVAQGLFGQPTASQPVRVPTGTAWRMGAVVLGCVLWSMTAAASGLVVATVAGLTTVLALEQSGSVLMLRQRLCGAISGVAVACVLIVGISGFGDRFPLYLVLLMSVFACTEWLAMRRQEIAPGCRQAAAMLAVAATMGGSPDTSVALACSRAVAVLTGFGIAACVFLLIRSDRLDRR